MTLSPRFFWLAVDHPEKGQQIEAQVRANKSRSPPATSSNSTSCWTAAWWTSKAGHHCARRKSQEMEAQPSLLTLCQSLNQRADPELPEPVGPVGTRKEVLAQV